MQRWLTSVRGLLSLTLFVLVTLVVSVPLIILSLAKLLLQKTPLRSGLTRTLDEVARVWISANNVHQRLLLPTRIHLTGSRNLDASQWYMLVVNHQSWVDILVLLRTFNRRLPYWKFFLKTSLLWIPVLGLAFWALDFPYMRRHSKEEIERDPSLAGRDLEMTRRQCARYASHPVTVISYLEGTRFTWKKHRQQDSPYRHLLIPKAGGLAFTLAAMEGKLQHLLDVTIHYPEGVPTFWDYVCGRVGQINLDVKVRALGPERIGDYTGDPAFRQAMQHWVNQLWQEKDQLLESLGQKTQA